MSKNSFYYKNIVSSTRLYSELCIAQLYRLIWVLYDVDINCAYKYHVRKYFTPVIGKLYVLQLYTVENVRKRKILFGVRKWQ